jgi:large subunit ribosomal protein L15
MQLHNLKRKTKNKKKVSVGRGGTRGKTSGRGTKGQNSRAGRKKRPELRDIIKKIPKQRGRGKNIFTSVQTKPVVVNLGSLESILKTGDNVTPIFLIEKGVIGLKSGMKPKVKILGDGEFTKKITITGCTVSASAKEKIEKAGGTIAK